MAENEADLHSIEGNIHAIEVALKVLVKTAAS